MRKLIAGLQMTLDGFCNHDAWYPDAEIHDHYTEALSEAGLLLYGRTTYKLMEDFWPGLVTNPSGHAHMDEFAVAIDRIPKIVYSRTLDGVNWQSATLKRELIREEVLALKQQPGKPIFAGSPSMIVALTNMGLIDEYQINVLPVLLGKGLPLFRDLQSRTDMELIRTKPFSCGAILLYLQVREPRIL